MGVSASSHSATSRASCPRIPVTRRQVTESSARKYASPLRGCHRQIVIRRKPRVASGQRGGPTALVVALVHGYRRAALGAASAATSPAPPDPITATVRWLAFVIRHVHVIQQLLCEDGTRIRLIKCRSDRRPPGGLDRRVSRQSSTLPSRRSIAVMRRGSSRAVGVGVDEHVADLEGAVKLLGVGGQQVGAPIGRAAPPDVGAFQGAECRYSPPYVRRWVNFVRVVVNGPVIRMSRPFSMITFVP